MRAKTGLLILLGLFLLIGMVSADMADAASTIDSIPEWIVANGNDISEITVVARNESSGAIPSVPVTFAVTDTTYGEITTPLTVMTDANGIAKATFKAKTKSGWAVIIARVISDDGGVPAISGYTLSQDIDHDKAVNVFFNNPSELPTGSKLTLETMVTDKYGNRVDNKNPAEKHMFNLYMTPAEGRGFWDGSGYTLTTTTPPLQTDSFGNASVDLRIANITGTNMIFMDKIGSISHTPKTAIEGVAIQDPAYLVGPDHNPETVIANGVDWFEVSYHVYDPLMNPINGTLVHITTSDGETLDKESVDGLIYFEYGQKTEAQTNTISVTTANTTMMCLPDGTTGTCQHDLLFVNDGPQDLLLSGIPTSLSSLEQSSGTKEGLVRAVVVDAKGNPVEGEDVTFALTIETDPPYRITPDGGPFDETTAPVISTRKSNPLLNTTVGGSALAFFTPGAFVTTGPTYSGAATGNATVTATWTGKGKYAGKSATKSTRFTWRNYPSLSVKMDCEVTCKDAHVGDTINMGMSVFGDGAALAPNPIDAMLVMDKSQSMTGGMDGHTRIYWASQAGSTFVGQMDDSRDKVGLTSYCKVDTVDYGLSDQFTNVIAKINTLPSSTCSYTGTRKALKTAIGEFPPYDPASKSVRAIILLTDGEFNWYADPLARGFATSVYDFGGTTRSDRHTFFSDLPAPSGSSSATGGANQWTNQNMSEYAMSKNIRIYTISVSPDLDSSLDTWKVLDNLALSTGGKHFHADTGAALQNYYTQIAGELVEKAGGDAKIKLNFDSAKDGGTGLSLTIRDYLTYLPEDSFTTDPDSTHVKMVNGGTPIYDYTQNDHKNWTDNLGILPELDLKAGEMNLNDLWTANFKLKLKKAGNIQLFGPGDTTSSVCFVDVTTTRETCAPVESCNCPVKEDVGGGFNEEKVTIAITQADSLGADPSKLTVKWETTYVGDGTVVQTLSYKNLDITNPVQHYATAYTTSYGAIDPAFPRSFETTLDTSSWAPGRYSIRVVGSSGKASNSDDESWTKQETGSTVYLKLE
jgi:hypothetical protein